MFVFDLLRSFQPIHNPLGFGAADWVEAAVAVLLLAGILLRGRVEGLAARLAPRTAWCMLGLALLPVALRLALLAQAPVPAPSGADDFAHLLAADTLRHFRLANPPHPLHRFFESFFVLQQPTYSSIFPIGQGLVLALGWTLLGHPWAGVVLSVAAFCALCYWMLRAWTTPGWALAGGVLAVLEFGPLRYWMNTYWGGAAAAAAGCLVFGALPRLKESGRPRDGALLGAGLGFAALTRPFETVLVALGAALFLAPALRFAKPRRRLLRAAPAFALALLPAAALTLLHNRQVTGSWTTLPYQLSRYQYGVPTTFTVQLNPVPHLPLNREQQADYQAQTAVHGPGTDSLHEWWDRLIFRARYYRFFFLAPLYAALPFFLLALAEARFRWVALWLCVLAAGTNFYPYFWPHYIAAAAGLFVLVSVTALERLAGWNAAGRHAARLLLLLCGVQFAFWYGLHLFGDSEVAAAGIEYETWDFVNHGDPQGRLAVDRTLDGAPGRQLVFVRYGPTHRFDEWVHNAADIDRARVIWALDRGPAEDALLERYYADRGAWLLEPDLRPPRLSRLK